jgi:hypothetical protein
MVIGLPPPGMGGGGPYQPQYHHHGPPSSSGGSVLGAGLVAVVTVHTVQYNSSGFPVPVKGNGGTRFSTLGLFFSSIDYPKASRLTS